METVDQIIAEMREWANGEGCFNDDPEGEPLPEDDEEDLPAGPGDEDDLEDQGEPVD